MGALTLPPKIKQTACLRPLVAYFSWCSRRVLIGGEAVSNSRPLAVTLQRSAAIDACQTRLGDASSERYICPRVCHPTQGLNAAPAAVFPSHCVPNGLYALVYVKLGNLRQTEVKELDDLDTFIGRGAV